ncbi:MAG: ribonuclease HII [Verrucomicrobiota bacterium]
MSKTQKSILSWQYEQAAEAEGYRFVAGLDEAGRGCLAGPVVASAVVFYKKNTWPASLNDSKKLTRSQRQYLYDKLVDSTNIQCATASASVEEIDEINILQASFLAMKRAWQKLKQIPDFAIIDGKLTPKQSPWAIPTKAIVRGDSYSPSIAAASILAKETRDRMLEALDLDYPGYGLAQHKGYGTQQHLAAIKRLGISAAHRKSFAPIRQTYLSLR